MKRVLGKQQIAIMRYFKRLGGRGLTIGDARKRFRQVGFTQQLKARLALIWTAPPPCTSEGVRGRPARWPVQRPFSCLLRH